MLAIADAEITGSAGGAKTTIAVNAPDVWWALSGAPAQAGATATAADRSKLSNEPLALTVRAGDPIRVFGRSLAWTADGNCVSAAGTPPPGIVVLQLMNFAFKLMNCVLQLMNCVFKMTPAASATTLLRLGSADDETSATRSITGAIDLKFVFKMMNFVFKMMKFAFKMLNFDAAYHNDGYLVRYKRWI